MKSLCALPILCLMVLGCTASDKATSHYSDKKAAIYVDEGDGAHLLATHPKLDHVCRMAGDCEAIYATCFKSDRSGKTFWNIRIPGAASDSVLGSILGVGESLDSAADDFVASYRQEKAKRAYKATHPDETTNYESCGSDCAK